MASKTFNRNPFQVNVPSSKDVKDYYFNHYNWKGVNKNKNFLSVDQETFERSKNVFVDSQGILKSRPSIKKYSFDVENILNIWTFDSYLVILQNISESYQLGFYTLEGDIICVTDCDVDDVKLTMVDKKIFIFTNTSFRYFDGENVKNAEEFIYIPKTSFDALGVKTEAEDENILTTKEIYTYLYNAQTGISIEAYGKELVVEINGKEYEILFDMNSPGLITDSLFDVSTIAYEEFDIIVSSINTYAIFDKTKRILSYSATGNSFSVNFYLDDSFGDVIGKPKFSQNGSYVIIPTNKSLYIVSVVADQSTGVSRFLEFTDVKTITGQEDMYYDGTPNDVKFDFIDYDDFTYCVIGQFVIIYNNREIKNVNIGDTGCCDISYYSGYGVFGKIVCCLCFKDDYMSYHIIDAESGLSIYSYQGDQSDLEYGSDGVFVWGSVKVLENRIVITQIVSRTERDDGGNFVLVYDFNGILVHNLDPLTENFVIVKGNPNNPNDVQSTNTQISNNGNRILTYAGIYNVDDRNLSKLITEDKKVEPLAFTNQIFYIVKSGDDFAVKTSIDSLFNKTYQFNYFKPGENKFYNFSDIVTLDSIYLSHGNILRISEYREDDEGRFLWYIPKTNSHTFDYNINKLHPISSSQVGVFFNDEIWYTTLNEGIYSVIKSKLDVGVKSGSDVISSDDGSLTLFCTKRGLVALSYQNFVSTTDQVLSFLSDNIYDDIVDYVKEPVKIFKHDFWILLYKDTTGDCYVFDLRNASWWPMSYGKSIQKVFKLLDNILLLCDNKLFYIDKDYQFYYDYDGSKYFVDWYLISQKLHFSANNYYKRIVNVTLSSVLDTPNMNEPVTYNMDVTNYRKNVDDGGSKTIAYKINVIRTFVQRVNYPKVNEFQYTLRTDHDNKIQLPLSLSDITIKYKITGQVR